MATPEDVLEALMAEAELTDEVRDKLVSAEDRARLVAAGYELWCTAWNEWSARAPYELTFKDAAAQLAVVDLLGEEALAALDALWRVGRGEEALALRAKWLRAAHAAQRGARRG